MSALPPLIDTHTHCYGPDYADDQEAMLARAQAAGVTHLLLAATDASCAAQQDALVARHPALISQMMGLHPCEVGPDVEGQLQAVRHLLFDSPLHYVAVGEIGLDYHWDTTHRAAQLSALRQQLLWARQLDKPASIHVREAYDDFFPLLLEARRADGLRADNPGVVHCFSGTVEQAWRLAEMGFCLGIGGVVTYPRSLMAQVAAELPLERLVLETDAPYLSPVPRRGRRNEEAYLTHTAEAVARLRGISLDEVATVTTATAQRLFLLG